MVAIPPLPILLMLLCLMPLLSCLPFAADNPILGMPIVIPALQGDLIDKWGTGVSVEGMVCIEVLPKTIVVLA